MRKSDAYTIANYIDSKKLMYKAGVGVFNSYDYKGNIAIVCGSGNNAGDGYVLSLLLKEKNISSTLFLLAETVLRLTNSKSKIVFQPLPSDDPTQRKPDITLAQSKLDWMPAIELEGGLKETIAYFKRIL